MPLTGLDIYKLLPKTNCKACGKPTCLAFAMALAGKKVELKECPYVSEEARIALESAAAPPMQLVRIGNFQTGNETVLFRHDETFRNPTGIAFRVEDTLGEAVIRDRVERINALTFERVGQKISVDLVAVEDRSGNAARFAEVAKIVANATPHNIILMSSSAENMKAAARVVAKRRPLLHGADKSNADAMAAVAKEAGCALGARAESLEELAELTQRIKKTGVDEIVIDPMPRDLGDAIEKFTTLRRLAVKKNFRPLGYPIIAFTSSREPEAECMEAATFICKYAGIVVMNGCEPWQALPLLTLRQNLYTDPQKPIQVEPKLYKIGAAGENSPLLCTTNFSLTYYTVEGEIENSRVPAHLLSVDTEGTSVLTAFSADKFNEKIIHKAMERAGVESVVKHRKIIIPGYVAVLSGRLEEETGWEVLVGPKEASFIPKYLKEVWKG